MLTGKAVSEDAYLRVFDQLTQIRDRDLFSCRSHPVSPQDKINMTGSQKCASLFSFIFIDYIYLQKSHRFSTYIR